jgi:threonine dehydratase
MWAAIRETTTKAGSGLREQDTATLTLDDVREAARRIEGVAHRTPVFTSRTLDGTIGARAYLKCENFQRAGAFKFRGAYNKISSLNEDQLRRGVVAWSSGNHAQAVTLAAAIKGAKATIVMPEDAPRAKADATRGYGAEVITYDRYKEDREALAMAVAEERGLTPIPAYDDHLIMAGQGTCALELVEEVGELDALLVCVSGGGLIAGCATAAKGLLPDVEVIGVEPEAGDDTKRSLEAGERVRIPVPRTIADGLQVNVPGALTFKVNRRLVSDILLVSDDEIVEAMAFLFERMKLVTEPSGAAALAALLKYRERFAGRRVGVTISGGNVGLERFCEFMARRTGA